jgi:ferritin-like metal-binding protein YciE
MSVSSLRALYIDLLKDTYNAEKQIVRALPKMTKAASSEGLQSALEEHLQVTKRHVDRLEKIFRTLGKSPTGKKCKGMQGLLEEGSELLEEDIEPAVLDAGIIASAQKVEHYEICSYGTLRTFAEQLGENQAARLLEETLQEEKEADEELTRLATQGINVEAEQNA